jgi:hypothetical protein
MGVSASACFINDNQSGISSEGAGEYGRATEDSALSSRLCLGGRLLLACEAGLDVLVATEKDLAFCFCSFCFDTIFFSPLSSS